MPDTQVSAERYARNAPADDAHVDVIGDRFALGARCERVVAEACEELVGGQVADIGPARDEPLVALGEVLLADGFLVELRR